MYFLRNMTLNLAFLSLKKALFTNQFLRHRSLDENGANSTELYARPLAAKKKYWEFFLMKEKDTIKVLVIY